MLTRQQIILVQETFAWIAPAAETAAALFYARLFTIAPQLRSLFTHDMHKQGTMLMHALQFSIDHLEDPQALQPKLFELGLKHAEYGVEEAHYVQVGEALLWMLREGLQDEFTEEVERAWRMAYEALARDMLRAQQLAQQEML